MEINLNEIAFERLAADRLSMQERAHLNKIFTDAHRKYNTGMTDVAHELDAPVVLSMDDARSLAHMQLDEKLAIRQTKVIDAAENRMRRENLRKTRAQKQFTERIARINTDAGNRGMLSSTGVLNQLERAENAHNDAVNAIDAEIAFIQSRMELDLQRHALAHDARVEALAKRMHNESQRNAVAVVRERGAQINRNYQNWKSWQRARLELNLAPHIRQAIQDEIFYEYKSFLFAQTPNRAHELLTSESLFLANLTGEQWSRMLNLIQSRR